MWLHLVRGARQDRGLAFLRPLGSDAEHPPPQQSPLLLTQVTRKSWKSVGKTRHMPAGSSENLASRFLSRLSLFDRGCVEGGLIASVSHLQSECASCVLPLDIHS